MAIGSRVKSFFQKVGASLAGPRQTGTFYAKPGEAPIKSVGIITSTPATGEITLGTSGVTIGGGGGKIYTGGGGGGGGGGITTTTAPTSTTAPTITSITTAPTKTAGFSGKVEGYTGGVKQRKEYFVSGQKTGQIIYPKGTKPYAETFAPSTFGFGREEVMFGSGGATISQKQLGADVFGILGVSAPTTDSQMFNYPSGTMLDYGQQILTGAVLPPQLPPTFVTGKGEIRYMGVVRPVEIQTGLEGLYQKLGDIRSSLYAERLGSEKEMGFGNVGKDFLKFGGQILTGAGLSLVGTGLFVKNIVTRPIETIKNIPGGIKQTFAFVSSGGVANILRQEPGIAVGFVGAEVGQAYLPKAITKVSDWIRTTRLTKINSADIISPEYFAGQTFPSIKKGQTAGELLGEFQQTDVYGVTQLRGFTASPKPFGKATKAGIGSSELAGVYQAPKVSPYFLQVGTGEKRLFTFNPLKTTLRPSITQIIPDEFALVPGVSYSQKGLASLKNIKKSWGDLDLGKSYIPFVKTEKEAIIPAGTLLSRTDKRFFIGFEGRKIPIFQYRTATGGITGGVVSASELSRISSSSRVGATAYISSYNVASALSSFSKGSYSSIKRSSDLSSYKININSYLPLLKSSGRGSPSIIDYSIFSPPKSPGRSPPISPIYSPPKSPTYSPPYSPPVRPPRTPPFFPPSKPPRKPKIPQMKMFDTSEIARAERKYKETPSFYGALGYELGLVQPRKRTKGEISFGLPRESPFFKVKQLPTTLMGKVKRTKSKKSLEFGDTDFSFGA